MKRTWIGSALPALATILVFCTTSWAQNAQPRQQDQNPQGSGNQPAAQNPQDRQPGQGESQRDPNRRFNVNPSGGNTLREPNTGRSADAELAACLIVDNEGEVALSQLAQQRASHEEVKQFAQEMVQAHMQMITKLQQIAGPAGSGARTNQFPNAIDNANAINNQTAAAATQPAAAAPGTAATKPQSDPTQKRASGGRLDHVALKRELGELCKQTMEREFAAKSGVEFDKCYIGQQVGAHLHAIDAMKVARNNCSDQLSPILEEGIRTAETHLKHAKDLAKKLEGQQPAAK